MRRARSAALLGAGLVVAVFACTGEDPDILTDTGADAGGEEASFADGAGTRDAGVDSAAEAGEGDASEGGDAGVVDAGPPIWVEDTDAGAGTTIRSNWVGPCAFSLVWRQLPNTSPPARSLALVKADAPGKTCNEPKGERILVAKDYDDPTRADMLVRVPPPAIVVAYSAKEVPSGASPTVLSMKQIDPSSGRDMRFALMKTKLVVGEPMHPRLLFEEVFFSDATEEAMETVRLRGSGAFPGETGTGAYFLATYERFIGAVPQPAVAADSCVRRD